LGTGTSGTSLALRDALGLEYVASYLESKGYSTKVMVQGELSDEELVSSILKFEPKYVGFECLSYNVPRLLAIVQEIKRRNSMVKVVVGGYHATGDGNIVSEEGVDFAVMGEGEGIFVDLIEQLENGGNLRDIKGVAFKDNGSVLINPPRRERLEFASFPWPKREKEIMNWSRISGLTYPAAPDQVAAVQVLYSRGCPFNCYFCPSGFLWRNQISYRPPSDLVSELFDLNAKFGTNYVYFADLIFNLIDERVRDLCEEMIRRRPPVRWNAMLRVGTKPETFDLMKEAGCSRVAIGVELLDDPLLKQVKGPRQNLDMIRKDFDHADSIGLINRSFLLMGFPWEKKEYYQTMLEILLTLPIDNIRLAFVVPFVGTDYHQQWSQHMVDKNPEHLTGEWPLFAPDGLSSEEQVKLRTWMVRSFYTSKEYTERVRRKVKRFPYLKRAFQYFFTDQLIPSGLATKSPV